MQYSRLAVLNLYKSLLRYGKNITLTDKEFYLRVIREEFKKQCNVENPEERVRLIQVIVSFCMCSALHVVVRIYLMNAQLSFTFSVSVAMTSAATKAG